MKKSEINDFVLKQKCANRESNPGHKHGKLVCYHYTMCAGMYASTCSARPGCRLRSNRIIFVHFSCDKWCNDERMRGRTQSPIGVAGRTVLLAQWSERRSYVPKVTGSSPVWDSFSTAVRGKFVQIERRGRWWWNSAAERKMPM